MPIENGGHHMKYHLNKMNFGLKFELFHWLQFELFIVGFAVRFRKNS